MVSGVQIKTAEGKVLTVDEFNDVEDRQEIREQILHDSFNTKLMNRYHVPAKRPAQFFDEKEDIVMPVKYLTEWEAIYKNNPEKPISPEKQMKLMDEHIIRILQDLKGENINVTDLISLIDNRFDPNKKMIKTILKNHSNHYQMDKKNNIYIPLETIMPEKTKKRKYNMKKIRPSMHDPIANEIAIFLKTSPCPLKWTDLCSRFKIDNLATRKQIIKRIYLLHPDIEATKENKRSGLFVYSKSYPGGFKLVETLSNDVPQEKTMDINKIYIRASIAAAKAFVAELEKYIQ